MKLFKLTAFLLIVYAAGLVIGLTYYAYSKKQKNNFFWGINMGAFGLNEVEDPYQPHNVDKQIQSIQNLGVNSVRVNLEVNKLSATPEARSNVNDDLINKLTNAKLNILLIIEDPFPKDQFFDLANHQNGWSWGYNIASRYKGKIYAYQLANEVSGMTIKPDHAGRSISDYDPKKYSILSDWLTGLAEGIHDADPKTKRVISAHWVATAIIDQLISDGVQFEVIGWNWFSDMGEDPTNKTFEDGTIINLPAHFAGKNKEFWFTELNRSHGSHGEEGIKDQSSYLQTAIKNILKSKHVSGIFVFTLLDDPIASLPEDQDWGLITVTRKMGKLTPNQNKPAFEVYRQIVGSNALP